jgi:hypothetical protein
MTALLRGGRVGRGVVAHQRQDLRRARRGAFIHVDDATGRGTPARLLHGVARLAGPAPRSHRRSRRLRARAGELSAPS